MSTVPSGTRFIGISDRVNLTERKSAGLNADTQPYTIDDLVDTIGVGAEGPQGVEGPAGPPGPVGPAGLEWQGAWVSGTSYVADDAVGYGGASYFCILATSGTTTPNLATANWALLASQGAIGPQGAQGPTGPQGAGATQTLQQTVGLGNTVDDGEGPILTVTAESVKVQDSLGGRIKMEYTTGNKPFVEFGVPSSGGLRTTLTTPNVQTANRTITLPDATGTVALTSDFTKTRGSIIGGSFGSEVVLPYDINITNGSGSSNLFKLPNNAPLGKEIIVDCSATNGVIVYPFSGGGLEIGVLEQSSQYNISFDGLVKFTSFANNYWLVETLQRNGPTLEGRDLSLVAGGYYLASQSFTTGALSLATLNSNYPESYAMNGFQVFCPNIVGGGLVYTKINVGTWVSQPITTVS
jgi:hypothetical protein